MLWGLQPVQQQAAHGIVVATLHQQIHSGLLLPDERLPAERKLADEMGISRVTLREALQVLEAERYIVIRRGSQGGAFVAAIDVLDDIARRRISLNPAKIMRALEYRHTLEPDIAALACERRGLPELKRMEAALQELRQATPSSAPGTAYRAVTLFRLALAAAAHNPFMLQGLQLAMAELFLPHHLFADPDYHQPVCDHHQQLLTAISQRDRNNALALVANLIALDRTAITASLGTSSLSPL